MQDIYALSIAGPFGYWIASAKKIANGIRVLKCGDGNAIWDVATIHVQMSHLL